MTTKRPSRSRKKPAKSALREPGTQAKTSSSRAWMLALSLLASAVGGFIAVCVLYPSRSGPGTGRAVEVVIEPGETPDSLASQLASAGLVSSAKLFALYLRLTGGLRDLVPGVHLLTDDASARDLLGRLERRGGAHGRVTFPEGWTRFDMAKRLEEKRICPLRGFLEASTDKDLLRELGVVGDTMEGYLFPATYDLALDSDPRDVVRRMKLEFDRRLAQIEPKHNSSLLELAETAKLGPRELVILASMIEKEAVQDDERPIIASVFVNRLRDPDFKPRLLQSDPTSGYGCLVMPEKTRSCLGYTGKITPAMNNDADNLYSTYKHEGLPPGPISNPGAKSLEAAMAPSQTRYLYFVARGEGRHTFSETYAAHNTAIREGKSTK